ncbi:magnesium-protoporphyrin IX monomethyl ester cyclase [Longimycelium tulufanense]|uniref:Magnesium-protoporphyrin IX monomethyl ester cyclase n=1 Tax=Longimycelium tulufanense TaxID=907463 RepID=A0A8J3C7D8_9PSEU|nr:radical SAM protein [Longimycelium tulufanense]GGM48708.1 magnesium-protoporphyrin IX monomethyl ester cyclase [Longimycelium tulufanense]
MKVLVIWPPHVPSYFNAGHHTPLYMVAGHLRRLPGVSQVDVCEAGVLNMNWKAVGDLLFQNDYSVIAIMNDFDAVDGLDRFVMYARELSPQSRLVTFGRLSSINPGFFMQYDLDAVVQSGDYECGVAHVVTAVAKDDWVGPLPGTATRVDGAWLSPTAKGDTLPAEDWVLPDVREIPYAAYDRLYRQDEHKFCGIPFRRELVVPAARGCPVGCSFCEVHDIFGLRERRLSVDRVISYLTESMALSPFEYVAFYAPTFTLNRRWVRELCERFLTGPLSVRWKCATTLHHLTEELVTLMGRSGCVRISVGLETLEQGGHDELPKTKRIEEQRFREVAGWCQRAGIELNAFVIVGLPGTTAAGVARTMEVAKDVGARIRPTMYAPYYDMKPTMRALEISRYNRQIISQPEGEPRTDLYQFLFGTEDRLTEVYHKIPQLLAQPVA